MTAKTAAHLDHPSKMYHVTSERWRGSIQFFGLGGGDPDDDEPLVWLWGSWGEVRNPWTGGGLLEGTDVWEVDVSGLPLLRGVEADDLEWPPHANVWAYEGTIPPSRLKLVEDLSGKTASADIFWVDPNELRLQQSMAETLHGRTYEERAALREAIVKDGIREPIEVERRDDGLWVADGHQRTLIARALGFGEVPVKVIADLRKTADATNWRALHDSPIWKEHDAVIMTQMRGRDRYYEVYTYGEVFGHYQRLDEAKNALWHIYGDLDWQREAMPKVWAEHYYFGWTDEFTDPITVYVANLPKLGKMASNARIIEVEDSVLVALVGGRVVGGISFGAGVVGRIYVDEQHRRQGIATQLMRQAEQMAGSLRFGREVSTDGAALIESITGEEVEVSHPGSGHWRSWLDELQSEYDRLVDAGAYPRLEVYQNGSSYEVLGEDANGSLKTLVRFSHPALAERFIERVKKTGRVAAQTYYHGTGVRLQPGDVILPASVRGLSGGEVSPNWAFAGPTIEYASSYMRNEPDGPHIYEVEPLGEVVENVKPTVHEYGTREGWRVIREVPPPEEGWWKWRRSHIGKTASTKLVRALSDLGTVDVARTLWDEELATPADIGMEVGWEPTWAELEEARQYISRVSQDLLRSKHGNTITVYRAGSVRPDQPTITTLSRGTAETHADFKGRDGTVGMYEVNVSDVLYYSEALWGHGTYAEEEVGVMGESLRTVGKTAKMAERVYTSAEVDEIVPGAELVYGDHADAHWRLGTVRVADVSTWPTENRLTPIRGNEPPIVLIPNWGVGLKPDAPWFAEDGRHRVLAAEQSGVDSLSAFYRVDGKKAVKMSSVKEVRERYMDHQPDGTGSWACFDVAPMIQKTWGYKAVEGYYSPDGDLMDAIETKRLYVHWWNLLPDGRILDATAGQWRNGENVQVHPANDPRYITWGQIPEEWRDEVLDFTMWTHFTGKIDLRKATKEKICQD